MSDVSLQDIATVVNIIDVCTERGAFKGNEIYGVGAIREKLAAVVKANTKEVEAPKETEEGGE